MRTQSFIHYRAGLNTARVRIRQRVPTQRNWQFECECHKSWSVVLAKTTADNDFSGLLDFPLRCPGDAMIKRLGG